MKTIPLKTGRSIPQLGLGTWQLTGDTCRNSVSEALDMGYTHVDTADGYSNHREVGQGIKDSGLARKDLFLTTKIRMDRQTEAEILEFGSRMLEELQTDYVDLLLVHWPTKKVPFEETAGAMKQLVDQGIVKDIGISNFNRDIARQFSELSEVPVVMNQVEFHPLLFQKELLESCESIGLKITAYSPLAQGKVFQNSSIKSLAEKAGITPADLSIAWLLSKGIVTIPKATGTAHLRSNLAAAELEVDASILEEVDAIEEIYRVVQADGWRQFDW